MHIETDFYRQQLLPILDDMKRQEFSLEIQERNINQLAAVNLREGSSFCSFCARMKRGSIYQFAEEKGYKKIVLGHHREDLLETVLMNMFYAGQIKSMAPRYRTDDGKFTVLRPLAYVPEQLLLEYSRQKEFPILGYQCPHLTEKNGGQRQKIKELLQDLETENPQVKANLLNSLRNVVPSHLLDDKLICH